MSSRISKETADADTLVLHVLHGATSFEQCIEFPDRAVAAMLPGLGRCHCFGDRSFCGARKIDRSLLEELKSS